MAIGLYGSVNGQTKKITKLYGSVNGPIGITGVIGTSGVAGNIGSFDATTFWNTMKDFYYQISTLYPGYLSIKCQENTPGVFTYIVSSSNVSGIQTIVSTTDINMLRNTYGIEIVGNTEGYDNIQLTYVMGAGTRKITKLYGSVNGQTKRIF